MPDFDHSRVRSIPSARRGSAPDGQTRAPREHTPSPVLPWQRTLAESPHVRALAQLQRALNGAPVQRVKEVTGGLEYEVGDIVSFAEQPHIVFRVHTRYEGDGPGDWEYDVAENADATFSARGGELAMWTEPLGGDARSALVEALRALTSESTQDTAPLEAVTPQRGHNTKFEWNSDSAAEQSEVDTDFWSRAMDGVEPGNRRQVTASGASPLGRTPVAGGEAWASHQVDFLKQGAKGHRKQTGGFSFTYEGASADVDEAHWLQFISIKMVETRDGRASLVDDGDDRVWFTVDEANPAYGVDYSKAGSPYYPPSVQQGVGSGRLQKTMIDDPLPSVGSLRRRIAEGATHVVETDTFDTFLVQRGKVVYHGQVRVTFTCDASEMVDEHPITKTSEVTLSQPAGALPEAMRKVLHVKYPQFQHIV